MVRGIIVGAGSEEALVRLASGQETQALSVGADVVLSNDAVRRRVRWQEIVGGQVYVEQDGAFIPVGHVVEAHVNAPRTVDITGYGDAFQRLATVGPSSVELRVVGELAMGEEAQGRSTHRRGRDTYAST